MIDSWLRIATPGVGAAILVAGTTLAGFLVSTFFAGSLSKAVDRVFQRLPLAKLIYTAVKDLLSAFVGEKRRFDQPEVALPDRALRAGREQPSTVGRGEDRRHQRSLPRDSFIRNDDSRKQLPMTTIGYQRPESTSPVRATSHAAVSGMKPPNQALVRW